MKKQLKVSKNFPYPLKCKECDYNHISIDMCWCIWFRLNFDNTYNQDEIPVYCPLRIIALYQSKSKNYGLGNN
jgi:hypothetical protein